MGTAFGTYDESKIGKGVPVLLFFKETGAVFSEASEAVIRDVYSSGKALLPTYIVEMGTETGMTLKFGVFVEDTVVLLDGAGKRRGTLAHPKASEIKIILTAGKMP